MQIPIRNLRALETRTLVMYIRMYILFILFLIHLIRLPLILFYGCLSEKHNVNKITSKALWDYVFTLYALMNHPVKGETVIIPIKQK